ncbi:MAG: hypothetical protein IJ642_00385 [Oscillospiraceae bacterium]|nr:hypothetical protein [Oscillospiraceae bacterium]
MKRYMTIYLQWLTQKLQNPESLTEQEISALRKEVLIQIGFMQHERAVHFQVVILVGLAFFLNMGFFLYFKITGLALLCIILLILLAAYLGHYYFLENTTQKIYILYNRLAALDDQADYPNTDKITDKLGQF